MKNKLLFLVTGLAVIIVSAVYARSGRSTVFTFAVHPLAGYADQLGDDYVPEAMPLMDEDMEFGSLLDDK